VVEVTGRSQSPFSETPKSLFNSTSDGGKLLMRMYLLERTARWNHTSKLSPKAWPQSR